MITRPPPLNAIAAPPAATAMSAPGPVPPPVAGAPDGVPLPSGWPPLLVALEDGAGLLLACGASVTLTVRPTGAGLVTSVQAHVNGTEPGTPDTGAVYVNVNFSGTRIWSVPAVVSGSLPEALVSRSVRFVIGSDIATFPGWAPVT